MARRNLRFHRAALAVTLAAILLMAVPPGRQLYAHQRRIDAGESRLEALRVQNEVLQERLQRLADPEYVEKLAREQLGMVRPGEISYVLVPPEASPTPKPPSKPKKPPWYERVWNWLEGLAGG